MYDFELAILPNIKNKEDCQNAWNVLIQEYIDDKLLTNNASNKINIIYNKNMCYNM